MRTVREISSGGVVYRRHKGTVEIALIRVRDRWGLPKGQGEEGEGLEETALREVTRQYAYDHGDEHEPTLRSDAEVVSGRLREDLQARGEVGAAT